MDEAQRPSVGVVGAGLAGLALAGELRRAGHRVVLLEAGRSAGGRAGTWREDSASFDHGAQYFTARDPRFRAVIDDLVRAGTVAAWRVRPWWIGVTSSGPATTDRMRRHVGVPGMCALPSALARGLDIETGVRVTGLEGGPGRWSLRREDGRVSGPFGLVLVTCPAPRAAALLEVAPDLARRAGEAEIAPGLAVLASFERPLAVPFEAAFVESGPLAWVARDSSKPGRPPGQAWVLHFGLARSADLLEAPEEEIFAEARTALGDLAGGALPAMTCERLHRWPFARVVRALPGPLYDAEAGLGAAGDWCRGASVEHAFLAGLELADRVRRALDR